MFDVILLSHGMNWQKTDVYCVATTRPHRRERPHVRECEADIVKVHRRWTHAAICFAARKIWLRHSGVTRLSDFEGSSSIDYAAVTNSESGETKTSCLQFLNARAVVSNCC